MTKKLRVDDLVVESFETTRRDAGRGTVQAHEDTPWCTVWDPSCPCLTEWYTECGESCPETCLHTCPETCVEVCSYNITCPWGWETCNEECV